MPVAPKSPTSGLPPWLQRKERGHPFWLWLMTRLSLHLGRSPSRLVLYGIVLYFLLTSPSTRRASRSYLSRVLPHPVTWVDLYRHILTFASTIHDRIYLLNQRDDLFDIRLSGIESLPAKHQGGLLLGAHLGSFELLRSLAQHGQAPAICVAMYPDNARQINHALAAINPHMMLDIIPLGQIDSMLLAHQRLNEGALIGLLADRASGPDSYRTLPFLGAMAHFPSGPFRMALLLRKPVYFMTGLYQGGSRYDVRFELLADLAQPSTTSKEIQMMALMSRYVAALERHCRAAPYNWFNFYDFWQE